jgi:hypothetical protein
VIVTKKVEGEVDYNNGEFAELKTIGIEGIEDGLWLGTITIHRENTGCSSEEFLQGFVVGELLEIVTTTEITPLSKSSDDLNTWPCETGQVQ